MNVGKTVFTFVGSLFLALGMAGYVYAETIEPSAKVPRFL